MLIDSHAHIFPRVNGITSRGVTRGIGLGRIRVGNEPQQLLPPYSRRTLFTPEMLLANLDWAGVDRAVLLQGPFYGECNEYVLKAIQTYPERLAGLAYLDPWEAEVRSNFTRICQGEHFKGVKLECSVPTGLVGLHPEARLDDPEIAWLWTELASNHLVLVLDLGGIGSASYQTLAVQEIATRHPDLRIVIAHLAQPAPGIEFNSKLRKLWQEQINLGFLPNVWFDCAALPAYFPEENYPFPSAEIYLRRVIEEIGPAKVLWGTDQPGLLTSGNLPQLVRMITRHLEFLPPNQQDMILGENAAGIFFSDLVTSP